MFDIAANVGRILSSIPFPTYMPQEKELGFEWPGSRYGNHATCAAQGFFTLSGSIGMFAFNTTLCLYYACAVAFQMKEENIRRYVKPFIFGFPLVTGFGFSTDILFADSYNPPTNLALGYWCRAGFYPSDCTEEEDTCLRGDFNALKRFKKGLPLAQGVAVLIMVTSLALVVHSRFRVSRLTKKIMKAAEEDGSATRLLMSSTHKARLERLDYDTRAILLQSLAYIAAFMVGVAWPLMNGLGKMQYNTTTFKLGLIFLSIQGFFNLIVFLSHKIHNYRRIHRETTRWQVFKLLFFEPVQEPCFVSRISMVIDDDIQARDEDRVKLGLPLFRIMNEMDLEDCPPDFAIGNDDKVNAPDLNRRGNFNKNIEDPEDDQSESFVDDQRMNVSKNESKSTISGPSRKSVTFKTGDSAALQGVQVDDNDLISHDDSSNHRMIGTNSDTQVDDVSRSGMSGLSGFSSVLKSAGSFAPSMISGSTAGKNDPQLDK